MFPLFPYQRSLWSGERGGVQSVECEDSEDSEGYEVGIAQCEVSSAKCGVKSVVWGVRSVKCEVWSVECRVKSVECKV